MGIGSLKKAMVWEDVAEVQDVLIFLNCDAEMFGTKRGGGRVFRKIQSRAVHLNRRRL
jgi:hypothetical protein